LRIITIDGKTLTHSDVTAVAMGKAQVVVCADAVSRMQKSRDVVERIIRGDEAVYGINTGFGALVSERISNDDLEQLQINLVRSHACAIGEPMSIEATRAMMVCRANSLAVGNSGSTVQTVEQIINYLNNNVTPVVPRIGSLGASGDLAPLAHLALALIGEGRVWYNGNQIETMDALMQCGLDRMRLGAKDGLSLINGTSQMCGILSLVCHSLDHMMPMFDVLAGLSIEAKAASVKPFDARIHEARPHAGQSLVAKRMRQIMANSAIVISHANCDKVQDPYSFRCIPQVHGPINEAHVNLSSILAIEINSATDNPLVFTSEDSPGEVISQGNFHGEILAMAADSISLALFEICSMSERRMDQLLDKSRSGLPAFLAKNGGLESGYMIVHYVAAAVLAQMHSGASPRTAYSVPTSAGQEDHVSMGATSAMNAQKMVELCSQVMACEALISTEGLEYAIADPAPFVASLARLVRSISPSLTSDRSTSDELNNLSRKFADGSWLAMIEAENSRLNRL